ncbi:MAG: hypothetical protein LBC39_06060 [Methanobrevibacter sp.]|jgi:deoxyxylulose-5-phosphate synthase|nr:hypothetical protein [Candidatus Methanovirga aequatorialis]
MPYCSNSGGIYENVSTKDLKDVKQNFKDGKKKFKKSLDEVKNFMKGLYNGFKTIDILKKVFTAISAAISTPTNDGSVVEDGVSTGVWEGVKAGGSALGKNFFSFLFNILLQ